MKIDVDFDKEIDRCKYIGVGPSFVLLWGPKEHARRCECLTRSGPLLGTRPQQDNKGGCAEKRTELPLDKDHVT